MIRFATIGLLTTLLTVNAVEFSTEGSVPLESTMGQALLRKAIVLEPARHLNNKNNQNQGNAVYLGKYEIKYLGCNSLLQLYSEATNNINISNIQAFLDTPQLVRFALCPANSCDSCNGGGEYAVNMADLLDGYTEAQLSEEAYACEMVREACYCGNADDADVCEAACYTSAGVENCTQAKGEANLEFQRYLECTEIRGRSNNESQSALFIGPYCAEDGNSIHMGVFDDIICTTKAATNLYASRTGSALPFANQSIITTSGCMTCHDTQNNNETDQVQNEDGSYEDVYAVTEHCYQAYEMAVKCEKNTTFSTKDTSGCEFLESVLPPLFNASQSSGVYSCKNSAASAWIFAMTIAFGAYF